jgi:hypothetical protein
MGKRFLTRRTGLMLLIVVIAVAVLAVAAGPAAAQSGWHNGMACANCHTSSATPTNTACTASCHSGFVALSVGGSTKADGTCWGCHTPGDTNVLSIKTPAGCGSAATGCHKTGAAAPHVGTTTATCLRCHGTTSGTGNPGTSPHHVAASGVTAKPVLTIKLSKTTIKVKTKVTASGLAFPGAKFGPVSVLLQRKVKTRWVKVTSKSIVPTAASAWSWGYKPAKTGVYRMRASTKSVTGVGAGLTAYKTFKVK